MDVRAVVQQDLGGDRGVVQVEAGGVGGGGGVGDGVAGPVAGAVGGGADGHRRRDADLDHDGLGLAAVPPVGDGQLRDVDADLRVGLGGIGRGAGGAVAEVPAVGERVPVRIVAAGAGEAHRQRLHAGRPVGRGVRHRDVGVGVVTDPVERPGEVVEVVERAVRGDLHVHHAAGVDVEVVHGGDGAVGVEHGPLDEALGVVAEEEVAAVGGREEAAPVDRPGGDRGALPVVRVGVDRVDVTGAAAGAEALVHRPAVVATPDDPVELLPGVVAHVAAEEASVALVELEPPRVAEAVRPDRAEASRLAVERVVGRHRAVLVDPQDLAVRVAQVLGVGGVAVVADGDVELAVRAEGEAAADVQLLRGGLGPEDLDGPGGADVGGGVEADDVVEQVPAGVVEVRPVVGHPEVRVERDADQAKVAGGIGGERGEGPGQQPAVLDDLDGAGALQDEDSPVRGDLETGRSGQPGADDQGGLEVVRRCGLGRRRAGRPRECPPAGTR